MSKQLKTILLAVLAVLLLLLVFGGRSAEKTAKQYVDAFLSGKASKCARLMTDEAIENTGAPSRKVFINELDDALDDMIDRYKNKYGSRWKYSVKVVDVYDYTGYSDYDGSQVKEAQVEIKHKSRSLFNDNEGRETETLILVKQGRKWYVANVY